VLSKTTAHPIFLTFLVKVSHYPKTEKNKKTSNVKRLVLSLTHNKRAKQMPKIIGRPKVRFNLFDWTAEEETYILLFYKYNKGPRFQHAVGAKIHPNDWDRKKQRSKHGKHLPEAGELNKHLDKLVEYCEDIYDLHNKGRISKEDFKKEFKRRLEDDVPPEDKAPLTFLEFVEQVYNDRARQPTTKKGSLQVVHKVMVHLQTYANERRRKLAFSELNERFYTDFQGWLHSPPRNLSTNYVQKIFQNLKFFVRKAYNQHLHNDRSYLDFNPPSAKITKIALSFAQLDTLAALDLTHAPHLEKARDLFLIGCYSGQRYSDFSRFCPEHITLHRGERVLKIVTQKTNQEVTIPLTADLDKWLKKHDYTSPKMSDVKLNKYLKELGQMAGFTAEIMAQSSKGGVSVEVKKHIWELIASHVARRSFATNYYKKHPELIDNIMKITGHTTEKMFRAYIVTDKDDSALKFAEGIKK
jgi:integrase